MAKIGVDMETRIWTIGHSSHTYERFHSLLEQAGVTAIADVRSAPFSRHFPQYNLEELKEHLRKDGIAYSFLGKELGGRPTGKSFYSEGVANYALMAARKEFRIGLERVIAGAQSYRIALMCSEHNPLDCHRCLLVGRALKERGLAVLHVLSDGRCRSQSHVEEHLLAEAGVDQRQSDFLASTEERLAHAYSERARKVAFSIDPSPRLSKASSG